MAKAKKGKTKKKKTERTEKQHEDKKAWMRAYYHRNKKRMNEDAKKRNEAVKAGTHVVKHRKGTKQYVEHQRALWREEARKRDAIKKAAKAKAIIDELNKLYGPGSGDW